MRKKKVLQVAYHSLANGGIQAVIMSIVRNISNEFDFDIVVFTKEERYYDEEFQKYGQIYRIPTRNSKNKIGKIIEYFIKPFKVFFGVYKILKKGNYDVIHCHNEVESGICTFAAWCAGVKIRISHAHNSELPIKKSIFKRVYHRSVKKLIPIFSNVRVGCSDMAKNYMFGENDTESKVIYNAIDLNKFNPLNFNSKKSGLKFIHVGRFSAQKNQLFLIQVFKYISEYFPDATLSMVGFGENEESIRIKIEKLGLSKKVNIYKHDTDIPSLYAVSNYMIFPSIAEGLGIVLLEAQAMNVKCFVSKVVPKEANMGLCDFLDLSMGEKMWADFIIKSIIEDKGMSYQVNELEKEKYNVREVARKYKEIYELKKIEGEKYV